MLDKIDKNILNELSKNSRITMKELGEKIHMTGQATSIRVAKLEDRGLIEGYTIKLNNEKLGYPIHALITVTHTNLQNHNTYMKFISTQKNFIIHQYKISGDGCYILECKFSSNKELDEFVVKLNQFVNYKVTLIIKEIL